MSDTYRCAGCGTVVNEETGWCYEGDLNSNAISGPYCPTCRPPGRGYTLEDLQKMKIENEVQRQLARSAAELAIIEAGGMDVLDWMQGRSAPDTRS